MLYQSTYDTLSLFLFAGILTCLDGYMNIAMEQTEEYVNGQLKNTYGDAFVRGNNGKNQITFIITL
jgi:small nuclear ribonucleoprotein (snRNP)-like protein